MVKYKVNIIFKENGKSLNETITDVLKIEIDKKINNFNKLSCDYTYCSQSRGRLVNDW